MDSTATNDASIPDQGLPPVQPPSARFIARLFVIPGLIILVVVFLVMVLSYYGKRDRDAASLLQKLDSDNADIRGRGMNDLAQILKRTEPDALRWKTDVKLALDLTERLEKSFTELIAEEKKIGAEIANSTDKDKDAIWGKLRNQRAYVLFLAGAVGEFHVPVGAPVVCTILQHEKSPDLKGNTQQRRMTLWALMNMGENTKGYSKIPSEQQLSMVAALKEEAGKDGVRAGWARTALSYLDPGSLAGNSRDVVKVDETLARCAEAEDQFLRKLAAMSFNFWDGDLAEPTLLKLAEDNGRGTLLRVKRDD